MEEYDTPSDTDEEYDTPSDTDEESCPYENVWNEVSKRIKVSLGQICVKIEENDDPSVLTFLSDTINKGISGEFLSYQVQIEQKHNAIISHPSKGNRIKEMRRLEQLCAESNEPLTSEVYSLEIPNAIGFDLTFPNLKFVTIGNPNTQVIEQLRTLKNLEYLTIEGNMPIFTMCEGFESLELLTLQNIKCTWINTLCTTASSIHIHIINMQISANLAKIFKISHIQCTNVTVE